MLFLGSLLDHHQSITGSLHCPGTTPWQLDAASTLDAFFFPVFPPSQDFYTLVLLGFSDGTFRHGQDDSNACSFERFWRIGTTSKLLSFQLVFYSCLLFSESFRIISFWIESYRKLIVAATMMPCDPCVTPRDMTWRSQHHWWATFPMPRNLNGKWLKNPGTNTGLFEQGRPCMQNVQRCTTSNTTMALWAEQNISRIQPCIPRDSALLLLPFGPATTTMPKSEPFRLALLWMSGHATAVCSFDFAYLIFMMQYHDEN